MSLGELSPQPWPWQTAVRGLSQWCRSEAVRTIADSPLPGVLFLNTDPGENLDGNLLESLQEMTRHARCRQLVLEIHESAVADVSVIRDFDVALRDPGILLAFDDFGIGFELYQGYAFGRPATLDKFG